MSNPSEVARLRERIDLEIEAMARMRDGFAMVASHKMISHRYNRPGGLCEQLGQHIGTEEAYIWTVERLNEQ